MARLVALAGLLLLCGCTASPPMTYLHLAPVAGRAVASGRGAPITVAHVEMPPSIDWLALTSESGQSTLSLDPNASWAAPLGEMATRVLAQNLVSRLPGTTVLMPGEVIPSGGALVSLDADWQVLSPAGAVTRDGQSRVGVPSGRGAAAEVEAMSAALGRLADEIAAAMAGA